MADDAHGADGGIGDEIIESLPDDLRRAVEEARPEERKELLSIAFRQVRYEGPLPPSGMLKEYDDVLPGAADRIISMAERQSAHRQDIEKAVIASKSGAETLGVIFAGGIGLLAVGGGIFLIASGKGAGGIVSIITALGALAGAFVYGTRSEREERSSKSRQRDCSVR